jgi:rhamnosyltransferase
MVKEEVIYSKIEASSKSRSLCIVASYDAKSQVQKYVYHLLEKLRDELDAHVVFVTTSETLSNEDTESLSGMGVSVIHRDNEGYDFKSYFCGLQYFREDLSDFDNIFHVNDSVYGPFNSLRSIVDRMGGSGFDVWGMTDSWMINYHVQSYFVCFSKVAIDCLVSFWDEYSFKSDYKDVINQGEVGMSQHFLNQGLTVGAAFPVERYLAPYINDVQNDLTNAKACAKGMTKIRWYSLGHRAITCDPSFYLWRPFVRGGYPFLKKKLLLEWTHFGTHSGSWLSEVSDDFYKAKCLAQASIHRDRNSLDVGARNWKKNMYLHPFLYFKMSHRWFNLLRKMIS